MGCYSCCDYDADPPKFFCKHLRKARKEHHCSECGAVINPKERYYDIRAKWEGDVEALNVCLECEALRDELEYFYHTIDACLCASYGNLTYDKHEAEREGWSEDWCLTAPPPRR